MHCGFAAVSFVGEIMNLKRIVYPLALIGGSAYVAILAYSAFSPEIEREKSERIAIEAAKTSPEYFLDRGVIGNPIDPLWKTSGAAIAVGDLDNDGDLDMITAGPGDTPVKYFENVGTPKDPKFADRGPIGKAPAPNNNFVGSEFVNPVSAALADLDGDGYLDIVVASEWGVKYFENLNCGNNRSAGEFYGR
jgi:hypothetical protein